MPGVLRYRSQGKYTARERVEMLVDPGTFQEIDAFAQKDADGLSRGSKDDTLGESAITGWA